jgi:site-specific recombinase XerD
MGRPLINDNVVILNERNKGKKEFRNVGKDIYHFLYRINIGHGEELQSTAEAYERDIKRFFKLMWGKNLDQLEIEDLYILPSDIEKYQTYLVNMGLKSNTVDRNINAVRSLYNYFEENEYRYKYEDEWVYITSKIFKGIKRVDIDDKSSYGTFAHDEMMEMIELAKTLDNGETKSLAIELASVTSFRLEAIANINKSDFFFKNNTWVARVFDKKVENVKAIRTDLYDRLMANAEGRENLFDCTARTLQRTVDQLIDMMGLDKKERNLTFHSIKKYGINEVAMMTKGDMKAISLQGNHSSFETTMKYYLAYTEDYSKMPCLQIGQPIDTTPLNSLTKEQLIELINSSSRSTQYELLNSIGQ